MRDRAVLAICRHRHVARLCALFVVLVHPILHGTPLDNGALDALMPQLTLASLIDE